jgi:hypothetical protein
MKKVAKQPERRKLLKKLAYTAPILIALGQLTKPTNVQAGGSQPVSPPSNPFPRGFGA